MLYQIKNISIPQNKRKDVNEKILHLIENNLTEKYEVSANDIYLSYTGFGGLHGLSYDDYDSYHAFSEAKREIELGAFFTPHHICKFIIDCLKPSNNDLVSDMTAGIGNFFNWLPNHANVWANEIDMRSYKVMKFLYPDANITADDMRNWEPSVKLDYVLGNPPFNLKWQVDKEEYLSQLYYCLKAYDVLKVCTQQSLSSSVSINYVNKVIVTELAWNGASLHQFTAGFVRFDSESDNKEIHYVTYENSIEANLLKLILSKEKLTLFLKDEEINDEELFERFGVDFDILSMLMTKEKDQDGCTRLRWGEQQII